MKNLKSFLVILISLITISSCNEAKTHKGVWEREVNQEENVQENDSLVSFESALLEVQEEKSSEIIKEQKEEVKLTKEATIVAIIFVSCTIALFLYILSVLFSGFLKR